MNVEHRYTDIDESRSDMDGCTCVGLDVSASGRSRSVPEQLSRPSSKGKVEGGYIPSTPHIVLSAYRPLRMFHSPSNRLPSAPLIEVYSAYTEGSIRTGDDREVYLPCFHDRVVIHPPLAPHTSHARSATGHSVSLFSIDICSTATESTPARDSLGSWLTSLPSVMLHPLVR